MIDPPKRSRTEIAYNVATALCVLGFVSSWISIGIFGGSPGLVFLFWLSIAGMGLFGWRLPKAGQGRRDEYALRLFTAVRSGEIAEFGVFLRPFYTTRKMAIYYGGGSPGGGNTLYLENTLIKALSMPIVALGKPGEDYGPGRILTDEDNWKSAASELMRRASKIICMPSGRPGTQWELDEILRNQYLGKTVFLMPFNYYPFWFKFSKNLINDWDAVVAHMKSHGLRIPSYYGGGLLFAIRPTGCFIEEFPSLAFPRRLRAKIERLSNAIPPSRRFDEKKWTQTLLIRRIIGNLVPVPFATFAAMELISSFVQPIPGDIMVWAFFSLVGSVVLLSVLSRIVKP